MYTNLLIPTDGTKLSDKAVAQAIALAQALKAKLTVFHASPDYPMPVYAEGVSVEMISRREYAQAREGGSAEGARPRRREGRRGRRRCDRRACDRGVALGGDPRVREEVEVRRDRHGLARPARTRGLLLGSETTKVLTHSKLPVLVVR